MIKIRCKTNSILTLLIPGIPFQKSPKTSQVIFQSKSERKTMLENAKAVNLPQKAVKLPQKVGDSIKLCRV